MNCSVLVHISLTYTPILAVSLCCNPFAVLEHTRFLEVSLSRNSFVVRVLLCIASDYLGCGASKSVIRHCVGDGSSHHRWLCWAKSRDGPRSKHDRRSVRPMNGVGGPIDLNPLLCMKALYHQSTFAYTYSHPAASSSLHIRPKQSYSFVLLCNGREKSCQYICISCASRCMERYSFMHSLYV